eukprot:3676991-Pyramimonas_sp.AAC.1
MDDAVSSPVCAPQAVLPGCYLATLTLQMVLLGPVDRVCECHRLARLGLVVHDFGLRQVGRPRGLLADLVGATQMLRAELDRVYLPVARRRSRVVA